MITNGQKVLIKLVDGRSFSITLDSNSAPVTVANFLYLVDTNYYDGLCFHRIIPDFMIQAGGHKVVDRIISDAPPTREIVGEFFSNEFKLNYIKHEPGVISMARAKEKDSATSQFFICVNTIPYLDGHYAAFGRTSDEESLEVVKDIAETETCIVNAAFTDFPFPPVVIESIRRIEDAVDVETAESQPF
ncbi:MAG: peptidylprolyl isomerase [Christensenellaceae bacterium]|jgi:peptidyl-prolyl cis-trans isomerase B (cyclophilin B)|nr:peptidylprolyl isomerase [Christensenellaceae bacterium]